MLSRHRSFSKITLAPGRAPRPTVAAHVARIEKVVEIDEFAGQAMEVRGYLSAKLGQPRISVSPIEVAQYLIVSPIFLIT